MTDAALANCRLMVATPIYEGAQAPVPRRSRFSCARGGGRLGAVQFICTSRRSPARATC